MDYHLPPNHRMPTIVGGMKVKSRQQIMYEHSLMQREGGGVVSCYISSAQREK